MICPLYEEEDDFAWMLKGLGKKQKKKKGKDEEENRLRSRDSRFSGPGEMASRQLVASKTGKRPVPKPPPMPQSVQVIYIVAMRLA